jgi:hypothetical protein
MKTIKEWLKDRPTSARAYYLGMYVVYLVVWSPILDHYGARTGLISRLPDVPR